MTLQDSLGYRVTPANPLQRVTQRFASSRPGAWMFGHTAHRLDAVTLRVTRGRHTLAGLVAGIPVVTVTTTGRRSGAPRPSPLLAIPLAGDLALLGTNFGRAAMPAWALNLAAEPRATVTFGNRTVAVSARPATPDERTAVLVAAARIYPGYDRYQERITGRDIPVLVLSAAPPV